MDKELKKLEEDLRSVASKDVNIMSKQEQLEEEFDKIVGEVPVVTQDTTNDREICTLCGHPTKSDRVVLQLKKLISKSYQQGHRDGVEEIIADLEKVNVQTEIGIDTPSNTLDLLEKYKEILEELNTNSDTTHTACPNCGKGIGKDCNCPEGLIKPPSNYNNGIIN